MDWSTFIYTLLIALVAGGLSIFGVVLTLKQNNKQMQMQLDVSAKEKQQEIIDNRPELEISFYKKFFDQNGYFPDKSFQIDALMVFYEINHNPIDLKIYDDKNNYVRVEYEFKNIGCGIIEYVDLIARMENLYLVDLSRKDTNNVKNTIFDYHYSIMYYGKKLHQNDTIKMRLWYHKDAIIEGMISNAVNIGFKSFNKSYWIQNLNAPRDLLEESVLINENEYNIKVSGRDMK